MCKALGWVGVGVKPVSCNGVYLLDRSWPHYFSNSLHFHFNEKYITKITALDVFDAVRHRKGLMDHVDLSGLTYVD